MTEVGSFLYLLHSCREREGYLSPTTPAPHTSSRGHVDDGEFYLLDSADVVGVEVPFRLSSLFSSSRLASFVLDVFSEGKSGLIGCLIIL